MRSGPYKPGRAAEAFLSQRLAGRVVVPVTQLLAEAEQEDIDLTTLRRAAKRLSVTKLVCWALPDEQATGQVVAAVADSDPRVEQAVAEVTNLVVGGIGTLDFAIHQACQGDPELRAQVEAVLGKH